MNYSYFVHPMWHNSALVCLVPKGIWNLGQFLFKIFIFFTLYSVFNKWHYFFHIFLILTFLTLYLQYVYVFFYVTTACNLCVRLSSRRDRDACLA